jgi:hypothetical protein
MMEAAAKSAARVTFQQGQPAMHGDLLIGATTRVNSVVLPLALQMLEEDEALGGTRPLYILVGMAILLIAAIVIALVIFSYGKLWLQAFVSNARVSMLSLIGMSLRQVHARTIVEAQIMAMQAGVGTDPTTGITTPRLEAHYLAGGNVPRVIHALVAAHRADIDLDFDRAAAIDLAGRDVLDAVRTSVYPKVIDCPDPEKSGRSTLSAVAKNGVELLVRARVTVRTNLGQLIGGATEETIIARVGEGIITSIGSARGSSPQSARRKIIWKLWRIRTASRRRYWSGGSMPIRRLRSCRSTSPTSTWARISARGCKPIRLRPTPARPRRWPSSGGQMRSPASRK